MEVQEFRGLSMYKKGGKKFEIRFLSLAPNHKKIKIPEYRRQCVGDNFIVNNEIVVCKFCFKAEETHSSLGIGQIT